MDCFFNLGYNLVQISFKFHLKFQIDYSECIWDLP